MIDILDLVDGRIVGWLDETEVVLPNREHNRHFSLPLREELAAVRFDPAVRGTDTMQLISMKWHRVEFFRAAQYREPDGSRGKSSVGSIWYLVVDGPNVPPATWKARGWIKAGDDWLKR